MSFWKRVFGREELSVKPNAASPQARSASPTHSSPLTKAAPTPPAASAPRTVTKEGDRPPVTEQPKRDLVFPSQIEEWGRDSEITRYGGNLGVSVCYAHASALVATVFAYDYGYSTIPTGIDTPVVRQHFEQNKKDIEAAEARGGLRLLSPFKDSIYTVNDGASVYEWLASEFTVRLNGAVQVSRMYLTGWENNFIKIRHSCPPGYSDNVGECVGKLVEGLTRLMARMDVHMSQESIKAVDVRGLQQPPTAQFRLFTQLQQQNELWFDVVRVREGGYNAVLCQGSLGRTLIDLGTVEADKIALFLADQGGARLQDKVELLESLGRLEVGEHLSGQCSRDQTLKQLRTWRRQG